MIQTTIFDLLEGKKISVSNLLHGKVMPIDDVLATKFLPLSFPSRVNFMISKLSNSSLNSLKQRSSLCLGKEMVRVTNKTTRVPVAWKNVLRLNFKHQGHSV